jgi:hypothetical protein
MVLASYYLLLGSLAHKAFVVGSDVSHSRSDRRFLQTLCTHASPAQLANGKMVGVGRGGSVGDNRERTPHRKIRPRFHEHKHTSLGRKPIHRSAPKRQTEVNSNSMRDPGLAAVLSVIIPGVGQFYNGRILAGILWLIITPGLWIGTGGLLGWGRAMSSPPTPPTSTPAITGCVPEA